MSDDKYKWMTEEEFVREVANLDKLLLDFCAGSDIYSYDSVKTNINTLKIHELTEQLQNMEGRTDYKDGDQVKYAGIITKIKKKYTNIAMVWYIDR